MGESRYSQFNRITRSAQMGYETKSRGEIFQQTRCHKDMNPKNISIREARDSENHPNSFPIIIGLDETGSMGHIPHELIKSGLPAIIKGLQDAGIESPAVCFVAVGDHKSDNSPLQIGQFESGDKEMDHWLERVYLEGNGGGNWGESYPLVWYFGGKMTVTDSFVKRGKKGVLITIGDEDFHNDYSTSQLKNITGNGDVPDYTAAQLFELASKKWEVYHIALGQDQVDNASWRELLKDHCVEIDRNVDAIPKAIVAIIMKHYTESSVEPTSALPDAVEQPASTDTPGSTPSVDML